jgi:hypothetical protein
MIDGLEQVMRFSIVSLVKPMERGSGQRSPDDVDTRVGGGAMHQSGREGTNPPISARNATVRFFSNHPSGEGELNSNATNCLSCRHDIIRY